MLLKPIFAFWRSWGSIFLRPFLVERHRPLGLGRPDRDVHLGGVDPRLPRAAATSRLTPNSRTQ